MAESSDSEWGADVGLDDDFRASDSEDADDWLQDVEEMGAPASSATPTPAEIHSCSQPSATIARPAPTPPPPPPSKPRTPEQLPSTRTNPQVYHQPHLASPHRSTSRGGITPATPINPLFLEEDDAEGGFAGGHASDEHQHQHQSSDAATPTQGSQSTEVSASGICLTVPSTGEPVQVRQKGGMQGRQELGRGQQQQEQQQHSKQGNMEEAPGQGAQHSAPDKHQQPLQLSETDEQQQQQQQPLQLSEADEQQQLLQPSEPMKLRQEPLQMSEADAHDLSRPGVTQQQGRQQGLFDPQDRNAMPQPLNCAEIQPEQGEELQEQQQLLHKQEGVPAGAETQAAGVWSWAGAWGSKLRAAAEAAVAVAAPPPEPSPAEVSQGDAHEQQQQQQQQKQEQQQEQPSEPAATSRDFAARAPSTAAAAAAVAAAQQKPAAAEQRKPEEPLPFSAGEGDQLSKQADGSRHFPTHSPPHPVSADRVSPGKQPFDQLRQAQHKVDSNEGRNKSDSEGGHEEDDLEGPPTDEDLERGLQAIDDQVGRIGGALSSWWGGINRNTVTIMEKVEALVSSGNLQKAATSKVRGLERRIEAVGRNALHLLEDLTGQYNYNLGAMQAGGQDGEPQDFDGFFALYGGKQLCADLEALANECARICNRARSRLEGSQQEELDSTLAELGPIFSERLSESPGQQLMRDVCGKNEECVRAMEQLEQRYAPISYLSEDSQKRAQGFLEKLLEAARQVQQLQGIEGGQNQLLGLRLRVLEPTGQGVAKQQQQQQHDACVVATIECSPQSNVSPEEVSKEAQTQNGSCSESKGERGGEEVQSGKKLCESRPDSTDGKAGSAGCTSLGVDGTGSMLPSATQPASEREACAKVQELLLGLRVHATKRLAEVATAQLQLLLDHGASLSVPARSHMEAASPSWPSLPSHQGLLLHQQCTRIVADLHAAANASAAVAAAAAAALPDPNASSAQGSRSISPSICNADASAGGMTGSGVKAIKGGASNSEGVEGGDTGGRLKGNEKGGRQTKEDKQEEEISGGRKESEQMGEGDHPWKEEAGSMVNEQEQQECKAGRKETKGSSEKERGEGGIGNENDEHQREEAPELDCGLLIATAHTLQAELQSAAHNATSYVEEALRGLLYAVLVRHLVVTIAGGDGRPQEGEATAEAGVGRAVGCGEGQEQREAS